MCCAGGDKKLKGESTYTLGLAYDKAGDEEKALVVRNTVDIGSFQCKCQIALFLYIIVNYK